MTQVKVPSSAKKESAQDKKSGIKRFSPGEVIFHENDPADSLYIIQKGQLRLYRPKGKGFIEIAILRSGEVIGEMAYFDEKASRRSCSAAAIVSTEVIEISFKAFSKTMSNLNPWFKTIINTLADRLRKTNDKIKQLESNSISYKGAGDYVFFQNLDIVRLLSSIYLCFKAHGEETEDGWQIHYSVLKFYIVDVYNTSEVKLEEFKHLLQNLGFLSISNDRENKPHVLVIKDIYIFRTMMLFLNDERRKEDSKKVQLTPKALKLTKAMLDQLAGNVSQEAMVSVNVSTIFEKFKRDKIEIGKDEYDELLFTELAEELIIDKSNTITGKVDYQKLKRLYPSMLIINGVKKVNEEKS